MKAAQHGHINIAEILLAHKHIDVNKKQRLGLSAYMVAAENGQTEVMELLRGHEGLNIETDAALVLAAGGGQTATVKFLLGDEQLDVTQTYHGHTALTLASGNGHYGVVELLLGNGDIDINGELWDGSTALQHAANGNQPNIVQLLLGHEDIDVNKRNNQGKTALILAANHHSKAQIVRLLLEKNEIDVNAIDHGAEGRRPDGSHGLISYTALMIAIRTNNGPATGPLLGHEKIDVNMGNNNGWTALMIAACMWIRDQVGRVLSHEQAWLPDGYSQIFISNVFGPSGLKDHGSATLRCKI